MPGDTGSSQRAERVEQGVIRFRKGVARGNDTLMFCKICDEDIMPRLVIMRASRGATVTACVMNAGQETMRLLRR